MQRQVCAVLYLRRRRQTVRALSRQTVRRRALLYKLVGAVDAYEVSFVAVPAQRAAGVTKEFEGEEPPEEKEKSTDYTDAIRIRENFIYMEESNDE